MQQSSPGRIARFNRWRREQEARVNGEIERRGLPPVRLETDPTLRPSQTSRFTPAGWDFSDPVGECARRLAPLDLPEDFPDGHFIELAVHAKEIGWRFGDGDEAISMRAASKLAAMLQVEREDSESCEMDALQRWFEFEEWERIGLQLALVRSHRLAGALRRISDPSTVLRDRGLDRSEISRKFVDRWLPTCRMASELDRQLRHRLHLKLDDDHLRRMLKLAHDQVGKTGLPQEHLSRTPREQLAFLEEYLSNRTGPSYPLVTRASWGPIRADVFGLIEALGALYGCEPDAVGSNQGWMDRFTTRQRINPEVVLELLEMVEADADLDSLDAQMLMIMVLQRTAERWVYTPADGSDRPITRCQAARTNLLAIDGLVRATIAPAERDRQTRRRILAAYDSWLSDLQTLIDQGMSNATERDQGRVDLLLWAANSVGPSRDPESFARDVRRAMSSLGQVIPAGTEDFYLKQGEAILRKTKDQTWAFPGRNGEIRLGVRQFRDGMARETGLKRVRRSRLTERDPNDIAPPPSDALSQKTFVSYDTDKDVRAAPAHDPLDAFEASEISRILRGIAERDASWREPGSIKALVIENYLALHYRTISGRRLAAENGMRSYGYTYSIIRELQQRIARAEGMFSPGT